MARVTAPALSLDASGSIAGAIVFSKWKGRNYVRQLVKPSNPKSGGQLGVRAAFKFLSQEWSGLTAGNQATWEDLAEQDVVSEFNAFMKGNLLRNRNFLGLSKETPAAVVLVPSLIDTFTATAGERQITISINDDDVNDPSWGYLLYRSTLTGFTPAFDNLIAIIPALDTSLVAYVDTPLVPDDYYYDAKPFTFDGALGALDGEVTAEVT